MGVPHLIWIEFITKWDAILAGFDCTTGSTPLTISYCICLSNSFAAAPSRSDLTGSDTPFNGMPSVLCDEITTSQQHVSKSVLVSLPSCRALKLLQSESYEKVASYPDILYETDWLHNRYVLCPRELSVYSGYGYHVVNVRFLSDAFCRTYVKRLSDYPHFLQP